MTSIGWNWRRSDINTVITKNNGSRQLPFDEPRLLAFIQSATRRYPHLDTAEYTESLIETITSKQEFPAEKITHEAILKALDNVGLPDSDYRGEVQLMFENTLTKLAHLNVKLASYLIQKGDRLAQGIIAPVERAKFTVVDELSDTTRGAGGFGHTGVQ
ncbi:hypothetical protein ABNE30_19900 [Paenibacillus larvae]